MDTRDGVQDRRESGGRSILVNDVTSTTTTVALIFSMAMLQMFERRLMGRGDIRCAAASSRVAMEQCQIGMKEKRSGLTVHHAL